ncbi:E3 ubiquitin-protein ligase RHA2A [Vitis vinifera]|uniref:E3 ubiquitin-protein ligase RHA2A n=1 Tax=Vitis vinifera TaxID=29760 RepID=A0A438FYV4_VITVI|nr:E3 ubiquitin-protein ligase RHA2A [Vitis vinifera]
MESSSNMSILPASSALPLSPILMLCFFIFICYKLFPKIIPHPIMSNYIIPTAAHLTWAWDFLLHYSLFPNSHHNTNVPANGDQGLSLGLYKPEPGSKEAVDCVVCLCKIEEGEEIRELRCGHMFHRDCLDRWVRQRNGTCPLCRGCLAPPRMVNEAGEEAIVFNFCSFSSSSRTVWWLR